MPEPSLAVFDVHSTRIFPDFPYNERSKNIRLPLWSTSQEATGSCPLTPLQKPNATPYWRSSIIKNALDGDGERGRTAVTEWNEFAVLAFFWFLFWGNAKKGTRTISNDKKTNTLSIQKSNATNDFESQGATESCFLTSKPGCFFPFLFRRQIATSAMACEGV